MRVTIRVVVRVPLAVKALGFRLYRRMQGF